MDADPGKFTKQGLAKTWDGEESLIYYTDTSIKQYGMIVDSETGEHKGWIANEDADEMVDNKPEYEHEEESDDEEDELNFGF